MTAAVYGTRSVSHRRSRVVMEQTLARYSGGTLASSLRFRATLPGTGRQHLVLPDSASSCRRCRRWWYLTLRCPDRRSPSRRR
jgi:hypothetical protein